MFFLSPLAYFSVSCSREEAGAIEKELLEEFRFGHQQLIEIWGHACAMAVTKVKPITAEGRRGSDGKRFTI